MIIIKRIFIILLLAIFVLSGCGASKTPPMSEQQVVTQINDLFNGINSGDVEVIKKYTGVPGPVVEQLAPKLKGNVKLKQVQGVSIQGTTVQATARVEVVPLKIEKDIPLTFDAKETLTLSNPLKLLQSMMQ